MQAPPRKRDNLRRLACRMRVAYSDSRLGSQSGYALILALSMLVLLSIIGAMSLSDSSTELGIAGNYRAGERAFSAADRALAYGLVNGPALLSGSGDINLATIDSGAFAAKVADTANGMKSGLDSETDPARASSLSYLSTGPAPPGSGSDATTTSGFKALYYRIRVVGAYPVGATNPSRSTLESQFAQIVPN